MEYGGAPDLDPTILAFAKILANHFRAFVEWQKMLTTQTRLETRSLSPDLLTEMLYENVPKTC